MSIDLLRRLAELLAASIAATSVVALIVELEIATPDRRPAAFDALDAFFAAAFTAEYLCRWLFAPRRLTYPFTPFAVIDLLALIPFFPGPFDALRSLQALRLVRVLRVLKLYRYSDAAQAVWAAFLRIGHEMIVVGMVLATTVLIGAVAVFESEHEAQPQAFARLSDGAWFMLATVTTVGYGDKVPVTVAGRLVTAGVMVVGLIMYGTFISMMGSAFLDELKRRELVRKTRLMQAQPPPAQ
jgi:voltage-gated potassium channel